MKILEASSESLRRGGAPVEFGEPPPAHHNGATTAVARAVRPPPEKFLKNGLTDKKGPGRSDRKGQVKIVLNANGN